MIVLEYPECYTPNICEARRFTEDEKTRYSEWFRDIGFTRVGEQIDLPYITWRDLPQRKCDGQFLGCSNSAWILTDAEAEHYKELNAQREEKDEAEKDQKRREQEAKVAAKKEKEVAVRAQFDKWTVKKVEKYAAHHTFVINGETLSFSERDIFDFGVVVNPRYSIAEGVSGGLPNSIDGTLVWQDFRSGEGWENVRPLTENECACVRAIWEFGEFANTPIRM